MRLFLPLTLRCVLLISYCIAVHGFLQLCALLATFLDLPLGHAPPGSPPSLPSFRALSLEALSLEASVGSVFGSVSPFEASAGSVSPFDIFGSAR